MPNENSVPLRLYNTLTRRKEAFEPIDANNVRMYVCGPTVYDYAHIGNARPVIVFDVLFRLLRHLYGEDHVTYVRNITDVEDKINARALRDYPDLPLNEAIAAVTEKTADQFHEDVKALGCLPPTHEPRATQHIDGMIAMIDTLIGRGHAYVAQGAEGREVLFDVASMPAYGGLSKRKQEDQQAGARVDVKDHKKNPSDFVLWKESGENEPGWDGDFGGEKIFGRPGWHIECSVMSKHHLGEVFDIHGGGLDLIFPHHENEIAQSCCAHGTDRMANIWMHNGFLQVEGRKMSKSEGNFVTIHDLLHTEKFGGRKWPGEVLRLAMLMTHYREPIDFSVRRLLDAEEELSRISGSQDFVSMMQNSAAGIELPPVSSNLVDALRDDLNTPAAATHLRSLRVEAEHGSNANRIDSYTQLAIDLDFIGVDARGFAQRLRDDRQAKNIHWSRNSHVVDQRVTERLAFIADKNWAEADRIRDELLAQGIQLKDSKDSQTGERITTWEVKR